MKTETHGIKFVYEANILFIELSSRRRLAYIQPKIGINWFSGESITLDYINEKMAEVPDWAEGLQLRADGYECEFYRKD